MNGADLFSLFLYLRITFKTLSNTCKIFTMAIITLDIGGTKIASAIFFSNGEIMCNRKRLLQGRTGHEVGKLAMEVLDKLLEIAEKKRIQIEGVGVCIPGIVFSHNHRIWAPNIPGWENYPLYEELRMVVPKDIGIFIESDRTCFMYGEMWQGAAKGCHSAVFIAVGTGIGAGIIMDGHVLHGASDIIGATGWMALKPPYTKAYDECGCFEYYASGNGIGARARDAVRNDKLYRGKLRQKPISRITAHDVFQAYQENDPIAISVLNQAVEMWGMASANMVSLINPQKIIFGGGVFGPANVFIDDIYKEACKWAQPLAIKQVEFVPSQLSGNAGLIGAAYLVVKSLENGK